MKKKTIATPLLQDIFIRTGLKQVHASKKSFLKQDKKIK